MQSYTSKRSSRTKRTSTFRQINSREIHSKFLESNASNDKESQSSDNIEEEKSDLQYKIINDKQKFGSSKRIIK